MPATPLPENRLDSDGFRVGIGVEEHEKRLQKHVLHEPGVRTLILARFCTGLGLTTLAYGGMVYLATTGASQAIISLVGSIRFLTALVIGLGGGVLAEVMCTRAALITTYALQAAACFVVPTLW